MTTKNKEWKQKINSMTYAQLLAEGKKLYFDYRVSNCQWLVAHLAKLSLATLYANLNDKSTVSLAALKNLITINLAGKPLAYILKQQRFLMRDYIVNQHVLIPRSETEALVLETLALIKHNFSSKKINILDLATGSGVIGISLALAERDFFVIASDISQKALAVAKKNAHKFNCPNIQFVNSDMLTYFIKNNQKFDVIVANLPYISTEHPLSITVKNYEPHLALYAGPTGLDYLTIFLKEVSKIVNDKFLLVLEIANYQKEALEQLIKIHLINSNYQFIKDLNGYWRILSISNF